MTVRYLRTDRENIWFDVKQNREVYRVSEKDRRAAEHKENRAMLAKAASGIATGIGKVLSDHRIMSSIAGGALGFITFTPIRFDYHTSDELSRAKTETVTDPGDPVKQANCEWRCRNLPGVPDVDKCIAECARLYGPRVLSGGGYTIRWRLGARVLCNLHSIVPNFVIDVQAQHVDLPWPLPDFDTPGVHWSLRETLAFDIPRDVTAFGAFGPLGTDAEAVENSLTAAKSMFERDIRLTLQIAGAAGGFAGTMTLPEIMKGVGEILKGVGEMIPG